jgi:hypothetical protein
MDPSADPRPDLAPDSPVWAKLLSAAYHLDGHDPYGVWGALHGMRCLGAHIEVLAGQARIQPGEVNTQEYMLLRERYLRPHLAAICRLLANLGHSAPENTWHTH